MLAYSKVASLYPSPASSGLNSVVPEASLQEADDGMTLKQLGVKGQAAGITQHTLLLDSWVTTLSCIHACCKSHVHIPSQMVLLIHPG
jgi:hypothetical protein